MSLYETPGLRRIGVGGEDKSMQFDLPSLLDTAFSVKLNCSADPTQRKMTLLHSYTWMHLPSLLDTAFSVKLNCSADPTQ